MTRRAIIVGAGFSGLSAACHLRRRGYDVTVVEATDAPGGRAGVVHHDGYRFDTGPTVVTMLDLVSDTFATVDAAWSDYCQLERLDPAYTAHYADGSTIRVRGTVADTRQELATTIGPRAAEQFDDFVDWVGHLYRLEFGTFIDTDVTSVADLLSNWRDLWGLLMAGGFRSWNGTARRIFDDERLRRLFSFQAMYAGINPLDALGLFAVIAHMDTVQGVYAAIGGVQAIASGLHLAAEKAGVEFIFDQPIRSVHPTTPPPRSSWPTASAWWATRWSSPSTCPSPTGN